MYKHARISILPPNQRRILACYTIWPLIMLSSSLRPSNHRQSKPGRRAGKKGLLLQGHPRPWPFAKPRTFGSPAPKVPHRIRSVNRETPSPAPIKASCRHVQHSCGSAQHQRSTVLTSRPAHLWHCSSKVSPGGLVYLWALFLQALRHFCPRQKRHRAFRAPRVRPFGPLAQRVAVSASG